MNDIERELIERLDIMEEHTQRLQRAIIAIRNGQPFNEAFDEIFLEDKAEEKKTSSYMGRMMEHLLKLAYSTGEARQRNENVWKTSFQNHQERFVNILGWDSSDLDKNLMRYTNKKLQSSYEWAIKLYERAMQEHSDLVEGRQRIPVECPWTVEELASFTIDKLVNKLR